MARYVAFLGGINVGGHRVKMDQLAELFRGVGLSDVSTFIASGNVLFSTKKKSLQGLEVSVEKSLADALGYSVPTLIRTCTDMPSITHFAPFPDVEVNPGHIVHVCFFRHPFREEDQAELRSFETPMDRLRTNGRELYWLCHGRTTDSLLKWRTVGKRFGVSTARNVTMLRRLLPLISKDA